MTVTRNQLLVLLFLAETNDADVTSNQISDAIDDVGRSAVYEAVGALQRSGLLSARWDTNNRRRRRLLRINASGLKAIVDEESGRDRIREAARRFQLGNV